VQLLKFFVTMKKIIYTLIILIVTQSVFATQDRKVLIIGIDGARSDALQQANTPNLDALIANGLYTYDAWHCGITVSGPSWSTIMTGVWWNKHGVSSNSYTGSNYNNHPYFPTLAKQLLPNLKCVQVVEWAPMSDNVYNDGWNLKLKTPDGDGAATASVASTQLADPDLDCLFVYFDAVDLAGHSSGFSPTNPSYMQAIENVDLHVGTVLNALYARPNYANENWLILVVPDHGGIGTGHGGITFEERHIWWIASGASVVKQQITAADPGTYNLLGTGIFNLAGVDPVLLKQSPVQADIAVTALHHLVYNTGETPGVYPFWELDGKSWLNVFSSVDETKTDNQLKVFPNPTTAEITVWFDNPLQQTPVVEVYDLLGKMVITKTTATNINKYVIDLTGNACGTYIVKIILGKQTLTRKVNLSN